MRFKRQPRHEYEDTRRKRLAALRWQQRERDSFPLLAAEIGRRQPDIDTIMSERIDRWAETQQANRNRKAAQWREGRKALDQMEPDTRAAILAYWNEHKWLPGDPSYFLDMLHSIKAGRLVRQADTFRFATTNTKAAEAMQIDPTRKPPMIPGLTRSKQGGPTL
jgi:hypothetical protein